MAMLGSNKEVAGVAAISASNLEQVLKSIVENAATVMKADSATVYLYDQAKEEFYLPVVVDKDLLRHEIPGRDGVASRVIKGGKLVTADDAINHPILSGTFTRETGVKSCASLPLRVDDNIVGILFVNYFAPHQFTDDDRRIISAFAKQAAIAIQNAKLTEILTNLHQVGRSLTSFRGLKQLLEEIAKSAVDVLSADIVTLYQYDQRMDKFEIPPIMAGNIREPLSMKAELYGDDAVTRIVQVGQPYYALDAGKDPLMSGSPPRPGQPTRFVHREGIKSSAAVPLRVNGEIVGILFINYRSAHQFLKDERIIIAGFASQAAIAIQNARLYERVSERLAKKVMELEAMEEIDDAISSVLDMNEVLDLILKNGLEKTGAITGDIRLLDEATGELMVRASRAVAKDESQARIRIGEGIAGRAAEEKRTYLVPDVSKFKNFKPFIKGTRSKVAVPILQEDRLIGVLSVDSPQIDAFDADDVRFLEALARQAVIAIQNAERHEKLQETYDALQETQARLVAAERWGTLGKAAASLAHRMNNILGIIPVCVQEISTRAGEVPLIRDNLEIIDRNAKFILELADNLLKPFRLSVTEITGLFDVNLLLKQAVSVANIPSRIEVILRYGDDLPAVPTSKSLVDIFVELITNAVKAMPGEGKLEIGSRLIDDKWVGVWFTDTGCGIPPDKRDRIFDLFVTVREPEPKEVGTSLGFGLWWVKTFLQQQGADIDLAWSEVSKGSTFIIKLPVQVEG